MKTILTILSFTAIFFIVSCKKGNDGPDTIPTPPPRPDTLSAGWKKIIVDSNNTYADIFFQNNTTGYLVGNRASKSTDGGLTWNLVSDKPYVNIATTNDNKLFLVNAGSIIYRSADGGATSTTAVLSGPASDVFFIDNSNGFIIASTGLFNTTDGGITWNRVTTSGLSITPNTYSTIFFTNSNSGIVVTGSGVYKTNGSLVNWLPASFTGTLPTAAFITVFTTPNGNVYVGNLAAELYKSTDGGATFSLLKTFPNSAGGACDIHFVDNNTGYFSSLNRIYKTTDGGATWNVVVALGESNIVELHFTDATHGWACGSKGAVLLFN